MPVLEVNQKRNVLFLQGPLSPLYQHLGKKIGQQGCNVFRINFSVGDWLHWHGKGCFSYRGAISDWQAFVSQFIDDHEITDIVLHGDRRVYHKIAIQVARQKGLYIAVTELGILRPGWLTIEVDGLGLLSHFPDDPDYLLEQASRLPAPHETQAYSYAFSQMAFWDTSYNLLNYFLWFLYPGFRRHTPYNPVIEYTKAAFRLLGEKQQQKKASRVIEDLISLSSDYFVFPLQLNGDFQIRDYSPFSSMAEAIETVLKSFAQFAPSETRLLIKQHPLDPGIDKLNSITIRLAEKMQIEDRVHYIDGGNLKRVFEFSRGTVMVNSSAALEALDLGIAVKTLAPAIYDIPGITFQDGLDEFWQSNFSPDENLYAAFVSVLKHSTQVPGALYGKQALKSAVDHMAAKILSRQLNQPGGYIETPPRLKGNEDWFQV